MVEVHEELLESRDGLDKNIDELAEKERNESSVFFRMFPHLRDPNDQP